MRIKFLKKGDQRKFIKKVLNNLNCPSLRAFEQFGLEVNYSTMKNYFSEARFLSKEIFDKMVYLGKINKEDLIFEILEDYWGQKKERKRK
jgi:hypothetical protein